MINVQIKILMFSMVAILCSSPVYAQGQGDAGEMMPSVLDPIVPLPEIPFTPADFSLDGDGGTVLGVEDAGEGRSANKDRYEISPEVYFELQQQLQSREKIMSMDVDPNEMKTLFFTMWQYALMKEAEQEFLTRPPGAITSEDGEDMARGIRELSLSGISYISNDRWTVWFNGGRVTPKTLPGEAITFDVNREYIEFKWFDESTNLIYPIRLRPHQRFNLDSRMFLPGVPAR